VRVWLLPEVGSHGACRPRRSHRRRDRHQTAPDRGGLAPPPEGTRRATGTRQRAASAGWRGRRRDSAAPGARWTGRRTRHSPGGGCPGCVLRPRELPRGGDRDAQRRGL